MTIGHKFAFGVRQVKTKDFKWFYCPILESTRKEFHFFWWFGHKLFIALHK